MKKEKIELEMVLDLAKAKGYKVEFVLGGKAQWLKLSKEDDYFIGSTLYECYCWLEG